LRLLRDSQPTTYTPIASNLSDTGSYSWSIPYEVVPGDVLPSD